MELISIICITLILLFLAFVIYIIRWYNRSWMLPPGPPALPLIGSYTLRLDLFAQQMDMYAKKYPKLMSVYVGPSPMIIINDIDLFKDAYVKYGDITQHKPEDFISNRFVEHLGILGADAERWKHQRRFTLHMLRDFGLGKAVIENKIVEVAEELSVELQKFIGKPFDIHWTLKKTISNVIASILFKTKYAYEDDTYEKRLGLMEEIFEILNPVLNNFWFLSRIPGDPFNYGQVLKDRDAFLEWFEQLIDERKKEFDGECAECFVDAYQQKIRQEASNPDTTFTDRQMVFVALDLLIAGTDTTSTTLNWLLLYMVAYPEVQEKVRAEILGTVGQRMVLSRDRNILPYTDATISETMRISPVAAFSLPHRVVEDFKLGGYDIPKGTNIIPNFYSIMRDPRVFKLPDKFNPERFLDRVNGCLAVKKFANFVPFSVGRRSCLGESLAKMETFILFTTLIQRFEFALPKGDTLNMVGENGLVFKPARYRLIITPVAQENA